MVQKTGLSSISWNTCCQSASSATVCFFHSNSSPHPLLKLISMFSMFPFVTLQLILRDFGAGDSITQLSPLNYYQNHVFLVTAWGRQQAQRSAFPLILTIKADLPQCTWRKQSVLKNERPAEINNLFNVDGPEKNHIQKYYS